MAKKNAPPTAVTIRAFGAFFTKGEKNAPPTAVTIRAFGAFFALFLRWREREFIR